MRGFLLVVECIIVRNFTRTSNPAEFSFFPLSFELFHTKFVDTLVRNPMSQHSCRRNFFPLHSKQHKGSHCVYIEIFIVALFAGMSPGPDFFLVMKNSLGYGRRAGIASALGIATALAFHASYTILGLALIIQSYQYIFISIQFLGALYLAYLGLTTLLSTFSRIQSELAYSPEAIGRKSVARSFMNGFLCNILNPKAFVFFLSIFSQFISPENPSWVKWVYGLEVVLVIGAWFVLLSWMISSSVFRSIYQQSRLWLERCLGVILVYFAFRIFKLALSK